MLLQAASLAACCARGVRTDKFDCSSAQQSRLTKVQHRTLGQRPKLPSPPHPLHAAAAAGRRFIGSQRAAQDGEQQAQQGLQWKEECEKRGGRGIVPAGGLQARWVGRTAVITRQRNQTTRRH